MAAPTCTFDSLNINDGSTYTILPGVELGARLKTWDEQRSYAGGVTQTNVSEAYVVPMKFPMLVKGTSLADLDAKVQAINTKIDSCSSASPKNLVWAGTTYYIVTTPRVAYVIDASAGAAFWTVFDLQPNRTP